MDGNEEDGIRFYCNVFLYKALVIVRNYGHEEVFLGKKVEDIEVNRVVVADNKIQNKKEAQNI